MKTSYCLLVFVFVFAMASAVFGQGIPVGTPGSNNEIPKIRISTNIPGQIAHLTVETSPRAERTFLLISLNPWREDLTARFGPGAVLSVRPGGDGRFGVVELPPGGSFDFYVPGGLPVMYLQAVVIDPGGQGGVAITAPYAYTNSRPASNIIGSLPAPAPPPAPVGVLWHGMVLDPRTGIAYVIGGAYKYQYSLYAVDNVVEINPHKPIDLESNIIAHCPYAVTEATTVWDSRRNKAYIFSGYNLNNPQPRDIIQEYDPDTNQCRLLDDRLPSYDSATTSVYDPAADVVYLFGWAADNRVTVYDLNLPSGSRIRRLQVSPPVAVGLFVSAVRDSRTGVIYAFGNYGGSGLTGQLYQFVPGGPNGGTFSLIQGATLPSRGYVASVFDSLSGKVYLLGGNLGLDPTGQRILCEDKIYAFDPSSPGQGFVQAGQLPQGREGLSAVADPVAGVIIIAGGVGGTPGSPYCQAQHYSEIVAFNPRTGQSYEIRSLPSRISQSAAVRDPNKKITFVVGGFTSNGPLDSVIAFKEAEIYAPVSALADRFQRALTGAAAAWTSGKIIVFGGTDASYNFLTSVYEVNPYAPAGSQIRLQQETLPTGISNTIAVTDPTTQKIYLFGGSSPVALRTIQVWDPTRPIGQRLSTLSAQLPRGFAFGAAAYNTNDQSIYLFSGSSYSADIMKFTPMTGQVLTLPEVLPIGRGGLSAVFDSARGTFFLFGGDNTAQGYTDEVLEYNPVIHQIQSAGRLPSARAYASATFSPELGGAFYLGGSYYAQGYNDIVAFVKD